MATEIFMLPYSKKRMPGTWKYMHPGHLKSLGVCGVVSCPLCGSPIAVGVLDIYTISKTGAVIPAISCVNRFCRFIGLVILDGWNPDYH